MPELTPQELAELTERLRAGDTSAIKAAVAAVKPARKPKTLKVPKVPADPRVTYMKRTASNIVTLSEKIESARRTIHDTRAEIMRKVREGVPRSSIFEGVHISTLDVMLPSWQSELTRLAGELARCVKGYFNPTPTDTNTNDTQ